MSNPFVRRRLQTGISISYSNQVDIQNQEAQKIRKQKEKEGETALYNALYGQNNDIIKKVEELNPQHQNFTTYDNIPMNVPVKPNPIPLAPLFYDEKVFHLDSQMKPPQTARIIYPSKKTHEKPETTLERLKRKPLPKLAIPVSETVIERQQKSKSSRPAQTSLDNINMKSDNSTNRKRVVLNRAQRARMGEKIAQSQPDFTIEKRAPFLPLHFFDNEEYDKNVVFKVPISGAALYFFPFDDMLDWKNCNVINYNPPLFTIEWDGRTKQVYRISLRFDFDDQDTFEKRRVLAFKWRKYFEDQIYLDTFLRNQDSKGLPPPPPSILQNIVKRVGIHTEEKENKSIKSGQTSSEKKALDLIQQIIPNVIEEFYFGEKLANYQSDCQKHEKYILEKDLPLFEFEKHEIFASNKLNSDRMAALKFPPYKPMLKINTKICELNETIKLFEFSSNDSNSVNYIEFFDSQIQILKNIEKQLIEEDFYQFVSVAQKLVLNWPFHLRDILVKMIDLRISDMLYEIIIDGFYSFLKIFKDDKIKFVVKVTQTLSIADPNEDELISKGIEYLNTIRNQFSQAKSVLMADDSPSLYRDIEKIDHHYEIVSKEWIQLIKESFRKSSDLLDKIRIEIKEIPSYEFSTINDIFEHLKEKVNSSNLSVEYFKSKKENEDLKKLEQIVSSSISSLLKFFDSYPSILAINSLSVDFTDFRKYLSNQISSFRSIICEFISEKVFVLINYIANQTEQLKLRCQFSPQIIEDWYNRHLLFSNIQTNYNQINNDINSTFPLFDFLETFYYESKFTVSMAFQMKTDLRNFFNKLPEFLEIEKQDLQRLTADHFNSVKELKESIKLTFIKIERYNFKTDFDLSNEYLEQLLKIKDTYEKLEGSVKTEQTRDEMISLPINEYPEMNGIKRDLNLFLPLWMIHKKLVEKSEEWMSIIFLELSPNNIISYVKKWEETLKEQYETYKNLIILKQTIPDIFESSSIEEVNSDDPIFSQKEIVVLHENHPLLKVIEAILVRIDYLINHIPIIQHLCNPVLRNRHWAQISDVTGLSINQNEGLTWHWIIESGIEDKITEIASISRSANFEYNIEKALSDMIEEIRSLSVELAKDKGHTRMKDTTPIFKVLSNHQVRIQELFIPPYIKPFMMKIKEYEFLANNLRQILNRTLDAQNAIDDLAPAMESQDIRTQNQDVSANYDETVKIFNRLVSKFGDAHKFHDLVSNPKYFSIIDDVQGNISVLKEDLDKVIEQKRKLFPHFRYLSDSQLIQLISFSQFPDKFCNLFGSIYSGIEKGNAEEKQEENVQSKDKKFMWVGFRSIDGEIVKFIKPFENTPESVETIFENFDNAITQTLTITCFNLLKKQITSINRIVSSYPTQIVCLVYQIFFSQNVQKIFESADIIFSDRKVQFLNEQFMSLMKFIQTDINYLAEAARSEPTIAISNLVTVLIKQRDIIKELIDEKVTEPTSFRWTRHLRFTAVGTNEIEKFKVFATCGINSYEYGFNYTGGGPLPFVTDSSERIYASFMTNLSNNFNSIISGDIYQFKTTFIINFANLLGKGVFVYNCSSQNNSSMILNLINTSSLTNYFLVLRDFGMLKNSVVSDLTPSITSFARKKKKLNFALFATHPAVSVSEPFSPHIRLLFRHVSLLPPETSKIIETFLIGIGFSPNFDENLNSINYSTSQNAKLFQQLTTLIDSLSIISDPKFSAIFSLTNVLNTLAEKPLNKENPSLDVFQRLLSQVTHINSGKSGLVEDMLSIFELDSSILNQSDFSKPEIPQDILPSSKEVVNCLETFVEMLQIHRDIIILGKAMTGKSTIIKTAAKLKNKQFTFINPNAQSYQYLSSNKEKGLLYYALQNSDWIVFDSEISDDWMNILAVSMVRRDKLYFNDGCGMKIPESTRFIYETDSLSNATPSILSYCATIVLPEKSVTYKDLIQKFLNKIQNDERIIEPVSGKIFGTHIPMTTFITKAETFLNKILSFLCENLEFDSFSEIQSVNNFFEVLESMLTVHYYSNTKFDVFDQQSLSQMFDDFENIAVFASIWSFGARTLDDERITFEEKLNEFLEQNEMTIDIINSNVNNSENEENASSNALEENVSIFDVYYNTTKRKWKLWEDIGFNKFYSSPTTMTDICPEYLILNSKTIVSSLYLANLLISQGKNVLIESANEKFSSLILHLSIYTEFIGSHFSQHCFQFSSELDNEVIRNMVDQCLSGIRDGSRSTSRLPLLSLMGIDLNESKQTELLRYILDNGFVLNLNTFTKEVTTSMSFLFTSTIKDSVNERFLSHLEILRIPEENEMENSISQAIDTLCGMTKSHEIASIIINSIYQIDSPIQFNVFHILKLIQRVAMVMNLYPKSYFLNALSYESIAVLYDYTKSDVTIEVLNNMLSEISELLDINKYDPISEHLNSKFLSNLRSLKFRPISSLDEIATSKNEMAITSRKKLVKLQSSLGDIRQIFSHGKYINNFNGLSVFIKEPEVPMFEQQNILRIERMITTPKTHILINTKSSLAAQKLVQKTSEILDFDFNVYQTGQSLIKMMHDSYVNAGKFEKNVVLLVNEPFLNQSDFDLVYLMTKSSDIYGLLGPNEMLSIMSELHCKDGEEDPFHEDTLESKSNYHLLVRDFIGNCNNYFHLCIISNDESPNFENLFNNCSTLTINTPLKPLIHRTLKTNMKCKFATEILARLSDEISSNLEIPLLNSISSFNDSLLEKVMVHFTERYEILTNLTNICQQTEDIIKTHLDNLLNMEKQIQQLAQQIELNMEQAKVNIEGSQKEREEMEKEEKALKEQQIQAEKLRKESEESLSTTKSLMMKSAQELRMLSNRDISVIKTMNHPPRGVFLVVRSIVLIMGYKIEDKNDDNNSNQPSWILGKKILSDTSFLSNLMKQAMENLNDETLDMLKKYIDDPNFSPANVASSSTAAKSICKFVCAIVPYHNALKIFNGKQEQLRICEDNLKSLQKKHDIASYKLQSAAKEIEEFEQRTKNLQLNKERIELQLQAQKINCDKYTAAMQMMQDFFTIWKDEMKLMTNKKEEIEIKIYFIAICLALYGSFDMNKRDELFEVVKEVFHEENININERFDLIENIKEVVRINENEFGVRDPIHLIENLALFTISDKSWFFIIDSDHTIISLLKPVVLKRLIITSFNSSEFNNELLNALLGNDLLVVYDYQWETKYSVFNEIFESRGKDNDIFGKKVTIPADFQIVFIVEIFPDFPVFNSVLIENVATDEEIANNVASKLFTSLDPDDSHNSINTIKTLKDANNELKRAQYELEQLLLQNSDTCLNDEKVGRQFQNASKIKGRILQQISKLEIAKNDYLRHFDELKESSLIFVDLYHSIELPDGLNHFYNSLIDELSSVKLNSSDEMSTKLNTIYNNLRRSLYSKKAISIRFDNRVKILCKTIGVKIGQYEETIEKIAQEFGNDSLCQPSIIPQIIDQTSSRRPILLNCSYYLLKYLTMNDKTVVASLTNLMSGFNEALSSGKMLLTVLTDFSQFPNILSVISKIRSATSLSNDFRFFIFIDYHEEAKDYPSQMLSFCDFIDFNSILDVRRKMSLELSSMNLSLYDSPIPNKTTFWRRVLLLLAFFDSSANLMTQTIFQNQPFNEENFDLMVDYLKSIENPLFENIGHFFISTFYAVEQPQIYRNLTKIWNSIFGNQLNFTGNKIEVGSSSSSGKLYKVPVNYAPTNVTEIIQSFPIIDDSTVFGFEADSDAHFKHFTEQKWINSKFGKMDFTSIELKPIDVSSVVWYLKYEAEEVNKRFLLQQHRFTRGLRKLLNNLRSSSNEKDVKNPPVDLSVMFSPSHFFSLLKHKFMIDAIRNNAVNSLDAFRNLGFMLSNNPPQRFDSIEIENLIIINADFDPESASFKQAMGSRVIPTLFIAVAEVAGDDALKKVPLYHQGENICDVYIRAADDLNCESVLILTAFTDSTK